MTPGDESADFAHECEERVIAKLRGRRDMGRKKYGVSMDRTDLTHLQWLVHAQEEALDLANYLERLIQEEERREQQSVTPHGQN